MTNNIEMLLCDNFIIDWNRKAGCTIVKKMWYEHMHVLDEALEFETIRRGKKIKGWVHDFAPTFLNRFGKVSRDKLDSDKFIKIKYVRNPYDRAVSSYIHGSKHSYFPHNRNPSFIEFLYLLLNKELSMNAGDRHWAVQNIFPKVKYSEIIKIENIESETDRLNKKYNLNLNCRFSSHHHVNKKNKIKNFFNTPSSDVKKYLDEQGELPTYDSFYNNEAKEMVYEIYKSDIESYKYQYPHKNQYD